MTDIAAHIRIFDPDPTDDLVEKRTASIKDIRNLFSKKKQVNDLFQTANFLAGLIESGVTQSAATFVKEIETAIRSKSKSFVAEGEDLQLTVCAQLGALQLIKDSSRNAGDVQVADVIAIGLWSALIFQKHRSEAKLESLRYELLQQCQSLIIARAKASRRRLEVTEAVYAKPEGEEVDVGVAVIAGLKDTLNALKINAAIDREEIDLLWWVIAGWSSLLGKHFSSSENVVSNAIASGLEVGQMLRGMPDDAHYHLALNHVRHNESISLVELMTELGSDVSIFAAPYQGNPIVIACPYIFPLLASFISGAALGENANIKRPLKDWVARAMLESAAIRVTSKLPRMAL